MLLSSNLMLYVSSGFSAGGFCGFPVLRSKTERCNGHVNPFSDNIPTDKSASACVQIRSVANIFPLMFDNKIFLSL